MKSIKVAFFTEAGNKRGMGHLIRLYAIYQEFIANKIESIFFLDSDINYNYKYFDIQYFSWDNFSIHDRYDIIFIDSYEADIKIYNQISNLAKIGVYIDDFARLKYPKGVIINFAPDAKKLFYLYERKDKYCLLGLDYLPLRKNITDIENIRKKEQLFIMLGGADVKSLSLKIIQGLSSLKIQKIIVSNNKQIAKKLRKYPNVKVLFQPNDKELIACMAESSLAVSTASMSVYELAYLKTSTIILAISKNQEIGVRQFVKHKLAVSFVDINSVNWIEKLKDEVCLNYSRKMQVDVNISGDGRKKIMQQVLKLCKKS